MVVQYSKKPVIKQGWIRAVLLFVSYIIISLGAGYFVQSMYAWFLVSFLIALILVYLFRTYVDKKTFKTIGLDFSSFFAPDAVAGFCLGTFLVCAGTLVIYLFGGVEWIDIVPNFNSILVSAGIMMMIAVAEELVFRGYILRNLMRSVNKWVALLCSSLLFSLVHLANPDVVMLGPVNTFFGGLVTGITFIHTRRLWFPVLFHFSWNFIQGPVLGYPVSGIPFPALFVMEIKGNTLLNGGSYGFEGSLVSTITLLLAYITWFYLERMKPFAKGYYKA